MSGASSPTLLLRGAAGRQRSADLVHNNVAKPTRTCLSLIWLHMTLAHAVNRTRQPRPAPKQTKNVLARQQKQLAGYGAQYIKLLLLLLKALLEMVRNMICGVKFSSAN